MSELILKVSFISLFLFFFSLAICESQPIINFDSLFDKKRILDPQSAIFYADSILLQQTSSERNIAELNYQKALLFSRINDPNSTLNSIELAIPYFESTDENTRLISAMLIQATANIYLKNLSLASVQAMNALELALKINDNNFICKCYDTLSHIHYSLEDYDQSIKYLIIAAEIQTKIDDKIGLSATYNNIAIVYKNLMETEKALEYNYKSLEINKQQKDYRSIAKSYNNIGATLQLMNRHEDAMENYRKSIFLNKKHSIPNSVPQRSMASCLALLGQYEDAEEYLLAALQVEHNLGNTSIALELYDRLVSNMLEQQNYQQAIQYLSKIDSLEKIEIKQEHQDKLYMLANQQKLLKQENELKLTESKIQKRTLFISIIFGAIVLIMILIYIRKQNNQLRLEQKQLRLEQKVLRSQMNPHFIFNVMAAIQNTLLENKPLRSASLLSSFASLMRQNFNIANKELISLKEELSALENYISIQQLRFQNSFNYFIDVDPRLTLHKIQIPPLLLQPFVENAIEHGLRPIERQGILDIKIFKKEKYTFFTIQDNGIGYKKSFQGKRSEHAIDIFRKRLQLRNKDEELTFTIEKRKSEPGTIVSFSLSL